MGSSVCLLAFTKQHLVSGDMGTIKMYPTIILTALFVATCGSSSPRIEDANFWFLQRLETSQTEVNWPKVMTDSLSFSLDSVQERTVMNAAALNAVNPLLLITYLELEGSWPTGSENVTTFANRLLDTEQHYEKAEYPPKSNAPTSAIWHILSQNDNETKTFIDKFHSLRTSNRIASRELSEREVQERASEDWWGIVKNKVIDLNLGWPWDENGCWDIGAPHSHVQPCEFCDVKSALDMGPDLKGRWCDEKRVDCNGDGNIDMNDNPCDITTCPDNFPWVVATHSGVVSLYPSDTSHCSLKILSNETGLATWYGHLDGIVVLAGQTVAKGQKIARIAQDKSRAECDNSVANNGPHLHYSIWYDEKSDFDKPLDLKYVTITDIQFQGGVKDYDVNCTACDEECSSNIQSSSSGSYCPWNPERGSNYGHGSWSFAGPGNLFAGPPMPVAPVADTPDDVSADDGVDEVPAAPVAPKKRCFNVFDVCRGRFRCVRAKSWMRAQMKVTKRLLRGCRGKGRKGGFGLGNPFGPPKNPFGRK